MRNQCKKYFWMGAVCVMGRKVFWGFFGWVHREFLLVFCCNYIYFYMLASRTRLDQRENKLFSHCCQYVTNKFRVVSRKAPCWKGVPTYPASTSDFCTSAKKTTSLISCTMRDASEAQIFIASWKKASNVMWRTLITSFHKRAAKWRHDMWKHHRALNYKWRVKDFRAVHWQVKSLFHNETSQCTTTFVYFGKTTFLLSKAK